MNRELKKFKSSCAPDNYVKAERIDFTTLLKENQCLGEESCTNVYNDYFDTCFVAVFGHMPGNGNRAFDCQHSCEWLLVHLYRIPGKNR